LSEAAAFSESSKHADAGRAGWDVIRTVLVALAVRTVIIEVGD
jgi:hypothetical protein